MTCLQLFPSSFLTVFLTSYKRLFFYFLLLFQLFFHPLPHLRLIFLSDSTFFLLFTSSFSFYSSPFFVFFFINLAADLLFPCSIFSYPFLVQIHHSLSLTIFFFYYSSFFFSSLTSLPSNLAPSICLPFHTYFHTPFPSFSFLFYFLYFFLFHLLF